MRPPLTRNEVLKLVGPGYIHIALTTKCNLACRHCFPDVSRKKHNIKKVSKELSRDVLDKLIDQTRALGTLNQITFSGGAEDPLSENFLYAVERFAEFVPTVTSFTNGTSMDTAMITAVKTAGISLLNVSTEGADKDSYEFVRRGAKFETLITNLRHMKSIGLKFHFYATLMRHNLDSMLKLPALAHELGCEYINFTLLRGADDLAEVGLGLPDFETFCDFTEKLACELDKYNINSNLKQLRSAHDKNRFSMGFLSIAKQIGPCIDPFHIMNINTDGKWKPCCGTVPISEKILMEDWSLYDEFNGDHLIKLRASIIDGNYPPPCQALPCDKKAKDDKTPGDKTIENLLLRRSTALQNYFKDIASEPGPNSKAALYCISDYTERLIGCGIFESPHINHIIDRDHDKIRRYDELKAIHASDIENNNIQTIFICSPMHEDQIATELTSLFGDRINIIKVHSIIDSLKLS